MPLYVPDMENKNEVSSKQEALLFGGIGDARHLLTTLMVVTLEASMKPGTEGKTFHFTIVDIKAAAIARDLIVLEMLDDMTLPKAADRMLAQVGLYYTYLAPIMPATIYEYLQRKIASVIDTLEGRRPFPQWLDVPPMYRASVLQALRRWTSAAVVNAFSVADIRSLVQRMRNQDTMRSRMNSIPDPPVPKDCEYEDRIYKSTNVLMLRPNAGGSKFITPEAWQVLDAFEKSGLDRSKGKQFSDLVNKTWKPNVTMIDPEQDLRLVDIKTQASVGESPFNLVLGLQNTGLVDPGMAGDKGAFGQVSMWFEAAAAAISLGRHRIKIEAIAGDVMTVLEQIADGTVGSRQANVNSSVATGSKDVAKAAGANLYPNAYDKIHLSNIPDYTGGTLATFLYAMPVLKPIDNTSATACCLRNPHRFRNMADFNNEYVGLDNLQDIKKLFPIGDSGYLEGEEGNRLELTQYHFWERSKKSTLEFEELMPRTALETWLYRLFLKIAIPFPAFVEKYQEVTSPFNLTIMFRLCAYLRKRGYPAHWLADVLDSLCAGSITASARPPQSEPLKIRETNIARSALKQSTAPFKQEVQVLAAIWQPRLGFGLIDTALPKVADIHRYQTTFKEVKEDFFEDARSPAYALVLLNVIKLAHSGFENLRSFLIDDETADKSPKSRDLRETGLHVFTTWEWSEKAKTATYPATRAQMEPKRGEQWAMIIFRTDKWTMQAKSERGKTFKDLGPYYTDE